MEKCSFSNVQLQKILDELESFGIEQKSEASRSIILSFSQLCKNMYKEFMEYIELLDSKIARINNVVNPVLYNRMIYDIKNESCSYINQIELIVHDFQDIYSFSEEIPDVVKTSIQDYKLRIFEMIRNDYQKIFEDLNHTNNVVND